MYEHSNAEGRISNMRLKASFARSLSALTACSIKRVYVLRVAARAERKDLPLFLFLSPFSQLYLGPAAKI
jgi:hypothetical protein